jgi:hypothetical protein
MTVRFLRFSMAELPEGEHATFSFLDLITLGLVLEAIPDFTHAKVINGIVCLGLGLVNHAIGVRWKISRVLIPFATLTLYVYALLWCGAIGGGMKYLAAAFVGALIMVATVAAYSWVGKSGAIQAKGTQTSTDNSNKPAPANSTETKPQDTATIPPGHTINLQILDGNTIPTKKITEEVHQAISGYAKEHNGEMPTNEWVNSQLTTAGYRARVDIDCKNPAIGILMRGKPNVKFGKVDLKEGPCDIGMYMDVQAGNTIVIDDYKFVISTGGNELHVDSYEHVAPPKQ